MTSAPDENDRLQAGTLQSDPLADTERAKTAAPAPAPRRSGEPSEVASERALLGSLLWAGSYAPATVRVECVAELLADGEALYVPANRQIVTAMLACHAAGAEHEPVSVNAELVRAGYGSGPCSVDSLRGLVDEASTVSEAQARAYAHAIREAWARRLVIAAARQIGQAAGDVRIPAAEVVTKAHDDMTEVVHKMAGAGKAVSMREALRGYFDLLQSGQRPHLSTGLRDLDNAIVGLMPREVSVIAARTSVGKSALAAGIALRAVTCDPVAVALYVSLEMHAGLFCGRLAAAQAAIPAKILRRGLLSPTQWSDFTTAISTLAPKGVYFADSTTQTMANILALAEETSRAAITEGKKLALVVVDHVGLVKPTAEALKRDNRERQVAETSRGLRFVAERFGCHVLALAQINRSAEGPGNAGQIPKLHHIAESDGIARDADQVLIVHRNRDPKSGLLDTSNPAGLIVAKARNDDPTALLVTFDPVHVQFTDHNGEETFASVYG